MQRTKIFKKKKKANVSLYNDIHPEIHSYILLTSIWLTKRDTITELE